MKRLLAAAILAGMAAGDGVRAQDPAAVNKAIDGGCRWLSNQVGTAELNVDGNPGDELVLYTLVKAKSDPAAPEFQTLLRRVLSHKLVNVYPVALRAMALSALDPARFQGEIARCAMHLVDNQNADGSWGYSQEVPLPAATVSGGKSGAAGKTSALRRLAVPRRRPYAAGDGDNSNTQYAILGLRAGEDASVRAPDATWKMALAWFAKGQDPEGGWRYSPRHEEPSYPSMTFGGLGSVMICLKFTDEKKPMESPPVKKAVEWLGKRFTLTDNRVGREGNAQAFIYYHLYAMERAGALAGAAFFGNHDWYDEGRTYLLENQDRGAEAGSWEGPGNHKNRISDTCFAVLFLSRATKPVFTK